MIISRENTAKNSLFLVCPMDRMEPLIRDKFSGEAFFCSALGVYFEYDIQTQFSLWDLIRENRIDRVIFATSVNNVFYRQAFKKIATTTYPINETLADTRKQLADHLMSSDVLFPNFHLLAAQHMANQKERLLTTQYLGAKLTKGNVEVKAYVYQPQEGVFYNLGEVEKRGHLLSKVSCN